jgi:enoyl-CoA hydratase/carnithine racemase
MAARHKTMPQAFTDERTAFVQLFSTADQKEGVNAFLEKRPPNWRNA